VKKKLDLHQDAATGKESVGATLEAQN